MTPALVIFDCDGVLVDSEPIANRVTVEVLGEIGLPMTTEECTRTFIGRSVASCCEIMERLLGRALPERFAADWEERELAAFRAEVSPIPGIAEALERLGVPCCVASSGSHRRMDVTLGRTGLLERFRGRIFSASDVARGKPFPDLYLHAARSMGVAPGHCAVVEDSVVGVEAAVAAGMRVLGFARPGHADPAALAAAGAEPFAEMADLPDRLG